MVSAEQEQQRAIMIEQMNSRRLTAGKFNNNAAHPLLRNVAASYFRSTCLLVVCFALTIPLQASQNSTPQAQPTTGATSAGSSDTLALYRSLRTVGLDTSRIYKIRDAEFDLEDM